MSNFDIRAKAREVLTGKWPTAVLVGFIAALLGGGSSGVSGGFEFDSEQVSRTLYSMAPTVATVLVGVLAVVAVVVALYSIVMLILGGVVNLGYCKYNLKLVDDHEGTVGDLFSEFGRFGPAFLLSLLTSLFITLWTFLLVIPGIVAAYSYAMAPYILLEDPSCTALEALRRSKQMMKGNKWALFELDLSFIGWALLSVLTFGIGFLFLHPYMNASYAVFYRNLQNQSVSTNENPQYNLP